MRGRGEGGGKGEERVRREWLSCESDSEEKGRQRSARQGDRKEIQMESWRPLHPSRRPSWVLLCVTLIEQVSQALVPSKSGPQGGSKH